MKIYKVTYVVEGIEAVDEDDADTRAIHLIEQGDNPQVGVTIVEED